MDLAKVKKNTGNQCISTISDSCFHQRILNKHRNTRSNRFISPLMIFCRNARHIISKRLKMILTIQINYRNLIKSSPIVITKSEDIKSYSLIKRYNLNNIELKNFISEKNYFPNKPPNKIVRSSFHVTPYTEMINIWNDFYYLFSGNILKSGNSLKIDASFIQNPYRILNKSVPTFPSLIVKNRNSDNSIANPEYFTSFTHVHNPGTNDFSILLKPELTSSNSASGGKNKYPENVVRIGQKRMIISNENFSIFRRNEINIFQNMDNTGTIIGFSAKNVIPANRNGFSELVFPMPNNNSGDQDPIEKDRTSKVTKSRIDTIVKPLDMVLKKPAIVNYDVGIEDIKLHGQKIQPENPNTGGISNENPDEIGNIAKKVYKIIERRLSIEKEKRGYL